jgi:hypothetical protein
LPEEIEMANGKSGWSDLWLKEDWWAVWLGLGIIFLSLVFYASDLVRVLKFFAVAPPKWSDFGLVIEHGRGVRGDVPCHPWHEHLLVTD